MRLIHVVNRLMKPMLITDRAHASLMTIVEKHMDDGAVLQEESILDELLGGIEEPWDMEDGVRVIPVNGPIGYNVSNLERVCGITDIGLIREWTKEAMMDGNVTTLLYKIDSPGGEVTQIFETADFIAECGKKKRTIAFTDTMACSAAYALAVSCDDVIATPSADVASIGVYSYMLDYSKAYEASGVKVEKFVSGDLKGIGIPGVPLTDSQRQFMQEEVDKLGIVFREYVKARRPSVTDASMRGQTVSGMDAVEAGLVDGIVSSFDNIFIKE